MLAPRPPGGHWLLGHVPRLQNDPLPMLLDAARAGDVVDLGVGPFRIYLLREPAHVKHVLVDHHKNYDKQTAPYFRLRPLIGEGLLTSDGEDWLRKRRIAQPAFHKQRITAFADTMARAAEQVAARWEASAASGEAVDVAAEMTHATLRIVGETLLGGDVDDDAPVVAEAFTQLSAILLGRVQGWFPTPLWVPTPTNRRFASALRALEAVIYKVIERRRRDAKAAERGDLLSLLMGAQDEESGARMTDAQLRDEVMTMFLAGHETTATALTWTFYLLDQHPDADRRLADETRAVLGGRAPGLADLESLRWTRMVLDEALRLYPPVWAMSRRVVADDEVGGVRLPKGAMIFVSPWVTQRQPHVWEQPDEFRPERWADGHAEAMRSFSYFPFLGGPRQCIGNLFATMEAQLILATLAQRYRLTLAPGHPVEAEALLTLRSRHGMKMHIERR